MSTNILKRNLATGFNTQDEGTIANVEYSQAVGAVKTSENGQHLLPLPTPGSGTGYTTDISAAAYALPAAGRNLAIYNNSSTVAAITFGSDNTITALAAGATDAGGRVGLPCPANSWSYFAGGFSNWAITSASTLLVYLINDQTNITAVAPALTSNYTQY